MVLLVEDIEYRIENWTNMNFRDLDNLLIDGRAGSRAAECHGFLCGYLCVSDRIQGNVLRHFLLADRNEDDLQEECYSRLLELAEDVGEKISADDYGLELLLPDDTIPLHERGAALVQWCEGFLSGLGVAGLTDFDLLTHECRELIQDFFKICRLDAADMQGHGETDEAAFMELTEYVRMGAILLHDEMHRPRMMPASGQVH